MENSPLARVILDPPLSLNLHIRSRAWDDTGYFFKTTTIVESYLVQESTGFRDAPNGIVGPLGDGGDHPVNRIVRTLDGSWAKNDDS